MTQPRHRFCPRCGAAALDNLPFCPQCGFDLADLPRQDPKAAEPAAVVPAVPTPPATTNALETAPAQVVRVTPPLRPVDRATARGRSVPPVIIGGFLVMVGLLGYGLLTRSSAPPGVSPQASGGLGGAPAASGGAPALITGLTILSPTDGQSVATKDVNVIGTAPPGVTITQDISFGLDQHTTSDGTGHWAMRVGLKDGENKLIFRIGDDSSTRKEIRVVYTPQAQ
jgi:zinc ribbon protein